MTEGLARSPAARLDIQEMAATSIPSPLATMASGTVDIPTASTPSLANAGSLQESQKWAQSELDKYLPLSSPIALAMWCI